MEVNVHTCLGCDEELDDALQGPCPDCGSTGVRFHGGFTNQTLSLNERGIVMECGSDRPWQEQWHRMRALRKVVEEHYLPGDYRGDATVSRDVNSFFLECFHVGDWLWEDQATTLTKPQVSAFILGDPALSICEGIANTSKHHTRKNSNWVTARVHGITHINATGQANACIKWSKEQDSGEEDALDLVKRCYAAWRRYQKANGLKTLL